MALKEVCFLLGEGDTLLWSDTTNNPVQLSDTRDRWEHIWQHRGALVEIAHSHPSGPLAFSSEDVSTMRALEAALGRTLRFAVVAPDGVLRREAGQDQRLEPEPRWASVLRLASGMTVP